MSQSITKSHLPWKFALFGIVVGLILLAIHIFDYKYNLFHLPTTEVPPNFSGSFLYTCFEWGSLILCPGLLLWLFDFSKSDSLGLFVWILAVLLNGPIYYGVGIITRALTNFLKSRQHAR